MRAAHRITNSLVQEWIELFLEKNSDYNSAPTPGFPEGFENADVLGIQGQFAEIWRKIWKLKKAMWDDQELTGEQPREVLLDLIGHAFLAIDMMDRAAATVQETTTDAEAVSYPPAAERCGTVCYQGHTYTGSCKLRRDAGNKHA